MRKIFILAVIALTAASCEKEFKFSQPLSLSSEKEPINNYGPKVETKSFLFFPPFFLASF